MNKIIRLTENDLHMIVKESVRRVLNEYGEKKESQEALGALYWRIMSDVRSIYDERMKRARELARVAAKKRIENRLPARYFVNGINKEKNKNDN